MTALDPGSFISDGPAEGDEPEPDETPADEAPAEPAPEPDRQAARLTPLGGRRGRAAQAQEALLAEIKGLRDTVKNQGETYTQMVARLERDSAELRGHVQGLYQRQPQREPERREPEVDSRALRSQARKALDDKNFDEYERLTSEAIIADTIAKVRPLIPQATQQGGQPQAHPVLQAMAGQYSDVLADQDAFDLAMTKDRSLARRGMPEGPERWKLAFEEGRRALAGNKRQGQQFDQKSRKVLSGVPTGRNPAGAGEGGGAKGVRLTAAELAYAKKYRMTADEYAEHLAAMHPERIEEE